MPARSRPICAVSAFRAGNGEENRVGKALDAPRRKISHPAPLRSTAASTSRASRRSRQCRQAHGSACRAAAPKPAMPARFSVPPRWPRSCPPPATSGTRHHQIGRGDDGADALRAADLVRREDEEIAATLGNVERNPSRRLHGVDHQDAAAAFTIAAISATGWMTPVSLLAAWIATSGRPAAGHAPPAQRCSAARSTRPSPVDAEHRHVFARKTAAGQDAGMVGWRRHRGATCAAARAPCASPASAASRRPRWHRT